jgi:Holliday junction resolvase RusA-like endonuclease
MGKLEIFINGNVPSSKNGKRWTGKYLIHSKTTMRYIKESKEEYNNHAKEFKDYIKKLEMPYIISFKFYRKSRRKFDYVNPLQTVQDLMVKHGWLEDDNSDHILPMFEKYEYNSISPGVLITIDYDNNKKKNTNTLHKTTRLSKEIRKDN